MATPNRLDNYCYLMIRHAYVETQNLDVNTEAEILAVYHGIGMSVDRSLKFYAKFGS